MATLDIITRLRNQAGAGVAQLKGQLGQLGAEAQRAGGGFGSLNVNMRQLGAAGLAAAGSLAALGLAAKKGLDFIEEGARLNQISDTFDKLTASIGGTADALLGQLRDATMGMVSDIDLMMAANRFMSMGLAESGDEASKLATIAVTLGGAMGKEAGPAMEEFALLLANQSIPRLDTFGISAGAVRGRIAELTSGVNALDKETAFMQAVMEQAELAMARVGEQSVNTASVIKAQLINSFNELKSGVADAVSPALAELAGLLADVNDEAGQGAIDEFTASLAGLSDTLADVLSYSRDNAQGLGILSQLFSTTAGPVGSLQQALAQLSTYLIQNRDAAWTFVNLPLSESISQIAVASLGAGQSLMRLGQDLPIVGGALEALSGAADEAIAYWQRLGGQAEETAQDLGPFIEAAESSDQAMLAWAASAGLVIDPMEQLKALGPDIGNSLNEMTGAADAAGSAMAGAADNFGMLGTNAVYSREQVDELKAAIQGINTVEIDPNMGRAIFETFLEAAGAAADLQEQLDGIASFWEAEVGLADPDQAARDAIQTELDGIAEAYDSQIGVDDPDDSIREDVKEDLDYIDAGAIAIIDAEAARAWGELLPLIDTMAAEIQDKERIAQISADTAEAEGAVDSLIARLNAIEREITVTVTVVEDDQRGSDNQNNNAGQNSSNNGYALGGYTGLMGGYTHPGEYVFSAPAVSSIGVGALHDLHQRGRAGDTVTSSFVYSPSINIAAAPGQDQAGLRQMIRQELDRAGREAEARYRQRGY